MPVPTAARPSLAQPPLGEEVVISGIAGCYPDSENVYQFRDNLFNKVNMVTVDDRRWKMGQLLFYFQIDYQLHFRFI
jgi:fatty acid synthase